MDDVIIHEQKVAFWHSYPATLHCMAGLLSDSLDKRFEAWLYHSLSCFGMRYSPNLNFRRAQEPCFDLTKVTYYSKPHKKMTHMVCSPTHLKNVDDLASVIMKAWRLNLLNCGISMNHSDRVKFMCICIFRTSEFGSESLQKNFYDKLRGIKSQIRLWSWRGLSTSGNVIIIKSF